MVNLPELCLLGSERDIFYVKASFGLVPLIYIAGFDMPLG